MNTQKNEEVCRYCKAPGHYKNKCPKLASRNNNFNQQQQSTESNKPVQQQRIDYNNHEKRQNNYRPRLMGAHPNNKHFTKPVVIIEPEVDQFPSLGMKVISVPVKWGGKSFTDIVKTEQVVDLIEVNDDNNGLFVLSSLNK
jgi:hypothetical protein